jgi:hypothetical protein
MSLIRDFLRQFRGWFAALGLMMVLYGLLRLLFWEYNRSIFPDIPFAEKGWILLRGAQQDLVSLVILNFPLLLLQTLGTVPALSRILTVRLMRWLFIILNCFGVALNVLDTAYFRFSKQRSSSDLFYVLPDSAGSLGSNLRGYFLFFLLFGILVYCIARMGRLPGQGQQKFKAPPSRLIANQLVLLLLLWLLTRGWEGSPVIPSTPLLSVRPSSLPLAQNSLYTFAYSLYRKQDELAPLHYFPPDRLQTLVRTNHLMGDGRRAFEKKNVILCILESFSRCYLEPSDPRKAETPFFDSLIGKSLYFPNAFANGFSSNQGIVAILGGLPAFLDEPFYYSHYANTPLRSLGNILKEKGYDTDFFLGAGRDHFGFGKFSRMVGIDHYYGRAEFDDDRFYDGNWGIFDEPFLQYGALVLSVKKQPFFAVLYNISSHPPFTLPPEHQGQFTRPGRTRAQSSISYVDYSFRRFFASCQKAPWFRNSLFVFCADHWLYPEDGSPYDYISSCSIPLFIYDPSSPSGSRPGKIASQVDITPTVLDLLHYSGNYTGFGTSLLDRSAGPDSLRYAINKPGSTPQIITQEYVLGYDPASGTSRYLFDYRRDSLLRVNLIGDSGFQDTRQRLETRLKANIQAYHQALIARKLD